MRSLNAAAHPRQPPPTEGKISPLALSGRYLVSIRRANFDARTRTTLHRELLDIWAETRKTICFVTHDIEEAVYLSDRIVVFSDAPGTVRDVVTVDLDRPRDRTGDAFTDIKARVLSYFEDEPS